MTIIFVSTIYMMAKGMKMSPINRFSGINLKEKQLLEMVTLTITKNNSDNWFG